MPNLADTLRGILAYHSTLLTRVEREALEDAIALATISPGSNVKLCRCEDRRAEGMVSCGYTNCPQYVKNWGG